MKKSISIVAALLIAVMFTACSKDQKVVKQLDGTWSVESMSVNGENLDKEFFEGITFTFETCKVSKGYCPGYTKDEDGDIDPFTYKITEKGEKFILKWDETDIEEAEILEHSKDKFQTRTKYDDETIIMTLRKI